MDDALLKRLITGEAVKDVWNHLTGDAVTVVYEHGGQRRRLMIGVEREGSVQPGKFYRSSTVLYEINGMQKAWAAESESPETAVGLVWAKAQPELLTALENGVSVTPVFLLDPKSPNGPHLVIWQHQMDSDQ